jgi:septum formation protein
MGITYEVAESRAEDTLGPQVDPTDPRPAAKAKALDIARNRAGAPVLAGDTIVAINGLALGKPRDADDARAMLRELRARKHVVRTALAIVAPSGISVAEVACPLRMRNYSDAEIDAYVHSGEPLDCAGAYDVHRAGGALVERVDGCFAAVVGFPIVEASRQLARAEITLQRDPMVVCSVLYGRPCLAASQARHVACLSRTDTDPN